MNSIKTAWENAWTRVGVTAAVVLLLFAGWYGLYYRPARAQLNQLVLKQRALQAGMAEMARAEMQIRLLRQETDSLKMALQQVQKRLANVDALQELIQRLAVRGRRAGLNFVAVTPDYTSLLLGQAKGPVQALPISVEAEGRFLSLGHFLEGLRQMPFYFEPTGLGLNYDPTLYPKLKIRVDGKLYLRASTTDQVAEAAPEKPQQVRKL
ncbi:MAG: type 4a pilus biogenesis protein PilO [Calditrichaeota bacterium]|nr:type 4a pilus biogenesis protein PilO [Calditrichota bacterium]